MPDNCGYPAFKKAPILLPQPVPVTGAPLSRSDQVRLVEDGDEDSSSVESRSTISAAGACLTGTTYFSSDVRNC